MTELNEIQAFVLRMSVREEWAPLSQKKSIIGIGWSEAKGLIECKDRQQFKNIIREVYNEKNERLLGGHAGSSWRFIHEMKKGDYVVIPEKNGCFSVAKVEEDEAYYDNSKEAADLDFCYRRRIKWIKKSMPRSLAENGLRRRMKARQTCVSATDLVMQIDASLKRDKPIDFMEEIRKKSREAVELSLCNHLNDEQLEYIVADLAKTSVTVSSVRLSKRQKAAGDVDVLATYDLKIANQESTINVAYQIKQHEGISNVDGIKQLIERREVDNERRIDRWCFVTTAGSVDENAQKIADDHDIIIITKNELIDWILDSGLNVFDGPRQ